MAMMETERAPEKVRTKIEVEEAGGRKTRRRQGPSVKAQTNKDRKACEETVPRAFRTYMETKELADKVVKRT